MIWTPTRVFFFKGSTSEETQRKENVNARDRASMLAGGRIDRRNVATLSSVVPPDVQVVDEATFLAESPEGSVVYAVNGVCESNTPGQVVSAVLAWGRPLDRSRTSFVVELYREVGIDPGVLEDRIEKAALQIYADQYAEPGFDIAGIWKPRQVRYDAFDVPIDLYRWVAHDVVGYQGHYATAFVGCVLF
jgi:pyruvoyl-dependent arginine decarboxylase